MAAAPKKAAVAETEQSAAPTAAPDASPVYDLIYDGPREDSWGALGPVQIDDTTRRPLGKVRLRLPETKIPSGYFGRWVNDDSKGRVQQALESGYSFLKGPDGGPFKHTVGVRREGGPLVAYFMIIPTQWYLADKAKLAVARNQRRGEMILGTTERGTPGIDGRYLPVRDGKPISSIRSEDMGKSTPNIIEEHYRAASYK